MQYKGISMTFKLKLGFYARDRSVRRRSARVLMVRSSASGGLDGSRDRAGFRPDAQTFAQCPVNGTSAPDGHVTHCIVGVAPGPSDIGSLDTPSMAG